MKQMQQTQQLTKQVNFQVKCDNTYRPRSPLQIHEAVQVTMLKQQNAIMSESILGYERQKTVSNVWCWKGNTDFLEVDKSIWESIKSFEDEE